MSPIATRHSEGAHSAGFWEQPLFLAALVFLSALPLSWPEIPPLVDLPGHMGRYRVQLELAQSPDLQLFYDFRWALIGNLGVDLLVVPLAKLFGLELAVKLIVLAIPPITVASFLWVAREVAGRVPPTALFALPLAYGYPFMFGFVNFALSMAFAFLAFALWLRLARFGRLRLRTLLFVPISVLIWITHTFGWGTLGVMAFSAELVRQVDRKQPLLRAGFHAALHCLALAPPLLLMLLWRGGGHAAGQTTDWFNWNRKLDWLLMALRDRWELFDLAALGVIALILLFALLHRKLEYSRNLAASAIFLAIVFALLPRIVFGSAYADMRLVPYLIAVAVIGIRLRQGATRRLAQTLAIGGVAFFLVRTAATTVSFRMEDRSYDREVAALDHVPVGAKLVSFVGESCRAPWAMSRLRHLPAIALVRKRAFSNDQWVMAGAQLLRVRYRQGWPFTQDPSQIVTSSRCPGEIWRPINQALAQFPRAGFDYVWLISPPPYDPRLARGLRPVWQSGGSVLFRVERGKD
ncbi:MAG: hypothetical protein M3Q08_02725 [Pseudomonadota bacterium]|nr:hypothetical protein [Pseudomonadota bacterium]